MFSLQRPFLHRPASPLGSIAPPSAADWGALGALCAAQMVRALDALARAASAPGSAERSAVSACVAALYDSYGDGSGRVEGSDELVARRDEIAGLRLAYAAWRREAGPGPRAASPSAARRAPVFFGAFATLWCQHTTPQMAALDARAKPHASPRTRVDAALSQLPAFAASRGCAESVQCELW
jgi:predicted metalloendopeptidase